VLQLQLALQEPKLGSNRIALVVCAIGNHTGLNCFKRQRKVRLVLSVPRRPFQLRQGTCYWMR
jgi:hypothetical protein